jgi:hypothetical protein
MRDSIRSRLSPPLVISAITLFVVLGSGYAAAFSGSGSLKKGATKGLAPNEFQTIRTLTDIGSIRAQCELSGDGDPFAESQLDLRFHNSSGKTLRAFIDGGQEDPLNLEVPNGGNADVTTNFASGDTVRYHIVRADGGKRNQADVTVSVHSTVNIAFDPNPAAVCGDDLVSVLALSTEG